MAVIYDYAGKAEVDNCGMCWPEQQPPRQMKVHPQDSGSNSRKTGLEQDTKIESEDHTAEEKGKL